MQVIANYIDSLSVYVILEALLIAFLVTVIAGNRIAKDK